MLIKMKFSGLVIAAAIVAILIWGEHPAYSADPRVGTGIWLYDTPMSISLINLTNSSLTYMYVGDDPVASYGGGTAGDEIILSYDVSTPYPVWSVDPFRTKVWNYRSGAGTPRSWDGRRTLTVDGHESECTFDLIFVRQRANNLAEHGFWVGLGPSSHGPSQGWAAANNWAYGRWATPVEDVNMHNVMTLINPKYMVSLYSGDNTNLVVVVQQQYAKLNIDGLDVIIDDTNAYQGAKLDFVDNDGYTVPDDN